MRPCPICQTPALPLGVKHGAWSGRSFEVARCPECRFAFVTEPWTDFGEIYGDAYYEGRGADPLVDYAFEMSHPERSIRVHEWRGITKVVTELTEVTPSTRWLDYGCGTGGLVRHLEHSGLEHAVGFEEGWSEPRLRERGVPVLSREELDATVGRFDVITAIEVLEHVPDPVATLSELARLLRPGGLLFVTTGNAAPHSSDLLAWPYLIPEIHISLFEPKSLGEALTRAGLVPGPAPLGEGWDDIIRFKTLKNLRRTEQSSLEKLVSWPVISGILNRRYRVSAHPVGWKPLDETSDAGSLGA